MTNPISSPYADFIQEQKKQKYLKKIDAYMISEYTIEFYDRILKLQKSILNKFNDSHKIYISFSTSELFFILTSLLKLIRLDKSNIKYNFRIYKIIDKIMLTINNY